MTTSDQPSSFHPSVSPAPLTLKVTAPYRQEEQHPRSLITAMHSLARDPRHPVALEIVGTPDSRHFQVRARDPQGLRHLAAQLRARYPQAALEPLAPQDDPLRLGRDEAISVLELRTRAAAYLPLRTFVPDPGVSPETDPLLGILAALDAVPSGMRAICQIALVPAPATWSARYRRKAIEHALDPERRRDQQDRTRALPDREQALSFVGSLPVFVGAMLLVGFWSAWSCLPPWITEGVQQAVRGHWPHLSLRHATVFYGISRSCSW